MDKANVNAIKQNKLANRIIELDIIRGIAIILMIIDHFFYDCGYTLPMIFTNYNQAGTWTNSLGNFSQWYWNWPVRQFLHYFFVFVFLCLTGICCSFSRSNIKRGLKLLLVAYGLTLITFIIGLVIGDIDLTISFGILHCISLALIISGLLDKIIKNKWVYLCIGIVLISLGLFMNFRFSKFYSYHDKNFILITLMEIVNCAKAGSDCFPFLLFGGQVFIGIFLGKLLYKDRTSLFKKSHYSNNFLTFTGRYNLFIYIAHQVVFILIMSIILLIAGYTLNF